MKRTGRVESIGLVIDIFMGKTQRNSLCSYLYLKLAKHVFCFMYVFSATKLENRWRRFGDRHWWDGEVAGKGVGR
jgi:hypothetical protein